MMLRHCEHSHALESTEIRDAMPGLKACHRDTRVASHVTEWKGESYPVSSHQWHQRRLTNEESQGKSLTYLSGLSSN
jgi:hypothetical protein